MSKNSTTKKPFPWKCVNCREKAVYEEIVTHEVDVEHDGRTYHVKIDGLKTPKCSKCGEVQPDSEANETITLAFIAQAKLLTPKVIRASREGNGLTQKQLALALGVAEATVCRWETGAQIQQRSLDNLLRLFFGIPFVRHILMTQQISTLEIDSISQYACVTYSPNAPIGEIVERGIIAVDSHYSVADSRNISYEYHGHLPVLEFRAES
jgi:putative zinc finger/helix-turn-helix YgiT family protein